MGIFDLFRGININEALDGYRNDKNAVLLDVRTREEYADGRIPGSINLSLQQIDRIKKVVPDKKKSVYVYCLSGARSRQAKRYLERIGYINVVDLGGFAGYKGKVER